MRRGQRIAGTALATVVALAVAGGGAYGVLTMRDDPSATTTTVSPSTGTSGDPTADATSSAEPAAASPTTSPTASPTGSPATSPATSPAASPTKSPEPQPVLEAGDDGRKVRELQARLVQLDWFTPPTTGSFDDVTKTAVAGFQAKRGFGATGVVDERSWRVLVKMSRTPSEAELFNRAGPTLFGPGASGPDVREIQARLRQIGWFFGDVSDSYGDQTTQAVSGFQTKRRVPSTGIVDQTTLDLLDAMTTEPSTDDLANKAPDPTDGSALDPRCTTGRVVCIDKTTSSLRWVVDGKVVTSLDVRFGSEYTPTREGLFHVGWKDADHVSGEYGSEMPFSMFFSGGQAVHYSSDFAARGYSGASHGCVNVRDYSALASLYDQVDVGDKVVVYWS